jgi:DNA topoisomerase VI subunit A
MATLEVREYLAAWRSANTSTHGPENRFKYALFIEKEGFDALIDESKIAERFDLAFFSTKGVSTTSARELLEALSNAGVTTFVAHDFDFSGFTIFHTLGHDTKRHEFETIPNVIDLGLRLTDVHEMELQSEPYELEQEKDPKIKLREYGATP